MGRFWIQLTESQCCKSELARGMSERKIRKTPTVDIYWRKLVAFSFVFVFMFFVVKFFAGQSFFADQAKDLSGDGFITSSQVMLEVKKNGNVYKNDQRIKAKISPEKDFDELRLVVYDKNGTYLDQLTILLRLPAEVAEETEAEILAIHGVESSGSEVPNPSTIAYTAESVGEQSTITVVAKLPKGVINLPIYDRAVYLLSTFSSSFWLIIAIIIPLLTLIYLLLLISLQQRSQKVPSSERPITAPPMALPPAVVGVLVSQDVGPREIAATLIDLSLRGYIFIIDRDRGFAFGKRSFSGQLLGFERVLLSKIFRESVRISDEEVSQRFTNHLYSKKMSLFTKEVYGLATRLGYFKENPVRMHRRYQYIGTLAFVFALTCFLLTFKYFSQVPYASFLWVGMMIASVVVVFVGSKMPIRTAVGRQSLSNWLAFKKYLSDSSPLPYHQSNYQKFVEYLPYAIMFRCEAMWARRFSGQEFTLPDWFLTDKESLGLNDFCLALYPIIGYVGQNLATIREPEFR